MTIPSAKKRYPWGNVASSDDLPSGWKVKKDV